jgi:outer membrane protein TolC
MGFRAAFSNISVRPFYRIAFPTPVCPIDFSSSVIMKNYIITLLIAVLCCPSFAMAQEPHVSTLDAVLRTVEANSVTLQALKQQTEAQKLANRTGIYLADPEIGFGYLWGSPSSIGNRTDFSVTQSFDFPTVYAHRAKIANVQRRIADDEYEQQRKDLLLQAGTVCVNLVYCNALKTELDKRQQHAQSIVAAWQKRVDNGDVDVLERNKAQLNLLNARKTAEANEIERAALLSELQRINGGQAIAFADTVYPLYALPQDFEQWYAQAQQRNPGLQIVARELEVSRQQTKLNRALSLPKFTAGYMGESVLGTTLQGATVGISIPLWENRNTIRQAKAQTAALQTMEADARAQFYNSLKAQHAKAVSLQALAADYREALKNNADLLKEALDMGQLSLIHYIMELAIYYDAIDQVLQAERDGWLATLELRQWEE